MFIFQPRAIALSVVAAALPGTSWCQPFTFFSDPTAAVLGTTATTATVQACGTANPGVVAGAAGGIDFRFQTLTNYLAAPGTLPFQKFDLNDPAVCQAILTTPLAAGACDTGVLGSIAPNLAYSPGCNTGLTCGTQYKLFVRANGTSTVGPSDALLLDATTQPCPSCGTLTQGYWKNHEEVWPVSTLTLGTVMYTKAQLLAILKEPVRGNGLISLAHQLIAAKLNVAKGSTCQAAASAIAAADTMIGPLNVPPSGSGYLAASATGSLTTQLDAFNNGKAAGCPTHCN